jgi:hypothetical protein
VITGLITFLLAVGLIRLWPQLVKDEPTIFATVTGLAGLYGVLFAVIEVLRAKKAAVLAAEEAQKASSQVRAQYALRDAAECQISIENALRIIDEGGAVPLASISRISKLYCAEFPEDYLVNTSDVRMRALKIESYSSMSPKARTSASKIRPTLVSMNNHLSAHAAKKLQGVKAP